MAYSVVLALLMAAPAGAQVRVAEPAALPSLNLSAPSASPVVSPAVLSFPAVSGSFNAVLPAPAAPLLAPVLVAPAVLQPVRVAGKIPAVKTVSPSALAPVKAIVQLGGATIQERSNDLNALLDAGRAFDGGRLLAASKDVDPVPGNMSPAPHLDPAPKAKRPPTVAGRLLRATALGVTVASLAPALWSALPTATALMLFGVSILPVAAAAIVLFAGRMVRATAQRFFGDGAAPAAAPTSRRAVRKIRALGLALGLALTMTTVVYHRPIITAAYNYMEHRLPASEREFKQDIPGAFFADETVRVLSQTAEGRAALDRVRGRDGVPRMPTFTVKETRHQVVPIPGSAFPDSAARILSRNAVGRRILDGLRDRGGVVRMPDFFISYQKGSSGLYTPPDVVFISVETIENGGVTVEKFLNDPQAQYDFLMREQGLIAHELEHAVQARRSPFRAEAWVFVKANASRLASAVYDYYSGKTEDAPPAVPVTAPTPAAPAKTAVAAVPEVSALPVVLDAADINRAGLTVAQFLNDPKAQKDYIAAHQAELAAALKAAPVVVKTAADAPATAPAAPTAKKAPFKVEFGMLQEWEYEAYITAHFYAHEQLKADPGGAMSSEDLGTYVWSLQPLDELLADIDKREIYAANLRGHTAYYESYLAGLRATWDAHRVEGYLLLARRALALNDAAGAKQHLETARAIAADKGLPEPRID